MTETILEDRKYTTTDEWVRAEGDDLVVGITDHAQSQLTDIVFVDLPAVGKVGKAGESIMVLESVKTVADLYAPANGAVTAVNSELKAHPEWVNQDPYGKGWIFRFRPTSPAAGLLSPAEYRKKTAAP
jgi:glycine cleavage system H protein